MAKKRYLACDFGASGGRLMLGVYDGKKIQIEEVYRFSNEPVRVNKGFYWDFLRLFFELKKGLKKIANEKMKISSIGIDTWGVDYGLIDRNGNLMSNPYHYRDNRTAHIQEEIVEKVSKDEIYSITGIQFMSINTLCQLYADCRQRPQVLENADRLLFMPDLFNFYLTGSKYNEYTISSTSQMLDARERKWAFGLLNKLKIPTNILQEIIMPCQVIGSLTKEIQEEVGLKDLNVVAVGSHDTASAVAGTPIFNENSVYLSSGTWSLLGIESDQPIVNKDSLKNNFTNEGGLDGKIRFLKNINGLWLIQQLKRNLKEQGIEFGFEKISEAAREAKNRFFVIDPNDQGFIAPLNMSDAIVDYCEMTNQGIPQSVGEMARAIYNGLSKEYKERIIQIEKMTERGIDTINMVGGGIQDEFLCQLTADVTKKKVVAGPIEAATLGNILAQLIADKEIENLAEGRKLVADSFMPRIYSPKMYLD